jgi:hypothetical protein
LFFFSFLFLPFKNIFMGCFSLSLGISCIKQAAVGRRDCGDAQAHAVAARGLTRGGAVYGPFKAVIFAHRGRAFYLCLGTGIVGAGAGGGGRRGGGGRMVARRVDLISTVQQQSKTKTKN